MVKTKRKTIKNKTKKHDNTKAGFGIVAGVTGITGLLGLLGLETMRKRNKINEKKNAVEPEINMIDLDNKLSNKYDELLSKFISIEEEYKKIYNQLLRCNDAFKNDTEKNKGIITDCNNNLRERDTQIKQLTIGLKERDDYINHLNDAIKERDNYINNRLNMK